MMEDLCQRIAASHMQRQAALEELHSWSRRQRLETSRKLQGIRTQICALREERREARARWRKAVKTLAGRRRHAT